MFIIFSTSSVESGRCVGFNSMDILSAVMGLIISWV